MTMINKMSIMKYLRRGLRRYSIEMLKRNSSMWADILEYKKKSKTTGCSWIDLWTLYKFVRKMKPKEILEFGPGLSTLVICYALKKNEKEGYDGKITSLEENEFYYNMAIENHLDHLKKYVDFILSPKIEKFYYLFRGVGYEKIPQKNYDFVFIDGPTLESPTDGEMTFDYDFLEIVKSQEKPVYGIIDYRLTTSFVMQQIFPPNKVKFDALRELCFLGPMTKNDFLELKLENLTQTFNKSFSLFGNTKIRLRK